MPTACRWNRSGVSLPEVLVAAVLLAVGVAGTLGALSNAVRFRAMALAREAVAAAAADRLSWFESAGCTAGDTLVASEGPRVEERWTVGRDPMTARLDGFARASTGARPHILRLESRRACD